MNLVETERPKSKQQMELDLKWQSEFSVAKASVEELTVKRETQHSQTTTLMDRVVEKTNMQKAYRRVKKNKGGAGIDGMEVEDLKTYLTEHWQGIKEQLLKGTYQPKPVKRVEIAKPQGGVRQLGIPTAVDRVIQQAILQILQPMFDPTFSEHSHGFRPNRSAHGAIREAQRYVQQRRSWVVDLDLEKFFDRVNHDILMNRLSKRIEDKTMLRIIRCYLEAGMMVNGVVVERWEGTPQGGPLSPLLANALLDEVDKELEKRGHTFVRYADDCNVYVRSEKAAKRVMESLKREFSKLKLKVNEEKSAIRRAWESNFLGFNFWRDQRGKVKIRISTKSIQKMKTKVRSLTIRRGGKSLGHMATELKSYLPGWKNYFDLAEVRGIFTDLDKWIRHRMRMIQLKQWRRGTTAYNKIRSLGHGHDVAAMCAAIGKSWWEHAKSRGANIVMPNKYFDLLGVPRLA